MEHLTTNPGWDVDRLEWLLVVVRQDELLAEDLLRRRLAQAPSPAKRDEWVTGCRLHRRNSEVLRQAATVKLDHFYQTLRANSMAAATTC